MTLSQSLILLNTLVTLAERSVRAAQQVSETITAAQQQGRDLTPEEVAQIKALRTQAMDAWDTAKPPAPH